MEHLSKKNLNGALKTLSSVISNLEVSLSLISGPSRIALNTAMLSALSNRAVCYVRIGFFKEAFTDLESYKTHLSALQVNIPAEITKSLYFAWGSLYRELSMYDKAVPCFEIVIQDGGFHSYIVEYAITLNALGRFKESLQYLDGILKKESGQYRIPPAVKEDIAFVRACSKVSLGKKYYQKVIAELGLNYHKNPSVRAGYLLCYLCLHLGEFAAAARYFCDAALSFNTSSDMDNSYKALTVINETMRANILNSLMLTARENPTAESISDVGNAYVMLNQPRIALDFYERAVSLCGSYIPAYVNSFHLFLSIGQLENANAVALKAWSIVNNEVSDWNEYREKVLMCYGVLSFVKKDFPTALKCFTEITKRNQKNMTAMHYLGRVLYETKRFEEAKTKLSVVLGQNPKNVEALVNRAKCNLQLVDLEGFEADLTRALRLEPEDAEALKVKKFMDEHKLAAGEQKNRITYARS